MERPTSPGEDAIEGWVDVNPADGEHVSVLLHVAASDPPEHTTADGMGGHWERVEPRTDSAVALYAPHPSSDGRGEATCRTLFFDQVMDQRSDAATAAALKCYARGVVSGTSTSIIGYEGWDANRPRRHALFGRTVSRCVGLELAEHVVTECVAKKLSAYLGFGVFNHRDHSVVDLLGHASGHHPSMTATPLEPSCTSGTLFPAMQEMHVGTAQRAGDVVRMALKELTRLEDRALVPSHATVFLSLGVAVPVRMGAPNGTCVRMARLHVMDVTNFSHLKLLARVGNDPDATPWLQRPAVNNTEPPHPLPLIAFGVGMENRCVVMATVPSSVAHNPLAETLHDTSSCHSLTSVVGCLARLRRVCLAASAFGERVGGVPPVPAEALPMWRALLESMRLRRVANRIEADTRASIKQCVKDETRELVQRSTNTQQALSNALGNAWHAVVDPNALPPSASGRSSWRVLRDRLALAREMQLDLLDTQQSLNAHRAYLMQLPVSAVGGMPTLSERHRCALLERSVRLLEEENKRQRALFARDVELLHLEVAPIVNAAASEAAAAPLMQRMLGHTWITLCTDVEQLLCHPPTNADAEGKTMAAMHRMVDDFADALKRDVSLLATSMPASGGVDGATAAAADTKRHALDVSAQFCASALNSLATQLALPTVPPTHNDLLRDEPLNGVGSGCPEDSGCSDGVRSWKRIVVERFNARTEHSRVRHMAEALALHVHRSIEHLDALLDELHEASGGANATHETTGPHAHDGAAQLDDVPAVVVVPARREGIRRGGAPSLREQVAAMIRTEAVESAQNAVPRNVVARYEPRIRLSIERCRAVQAALMDAAMGYAEAPINGDESLTTSLLALLSHGADNAPPDRLATEAREPLSTLDGGGLVASLSGASWGETAEPPADGETSAAQQPVPTLRVALDDILRGKRVKAAALSDARGAKPRVAGRLRQGFFSTGVVAPPRNRSDERGAKRRAML